MVGINNFACVLFGMFIVLFSQAFAKWSFYIFEHWLKSRKGQGKKKYIVKKKIKKGKCL